MGTFNDLPDPDPEYAKKQQSVEEDILAQIGWMHEKIKRSIAPYIGDFLTPDLAENIKRIFEREIQSMVRVDLGKDFLIVTVDKSKPNEVFINLAPTTPKWVKDVLPPEIRF